MLLSEEAPVLPSEDVIVTVSGKPTEVSISSPWVTAPEPIEVLLAAIAGVAWPKEAPED